MASQDDRLQPRKQPRQARAERTRERILTAAAHVFSEYGYAAGTTNHIAQEARVSIGSLYQYFPNKDAILAELLAGHLQAGADKRARGHTAQETVEDAVRDMVRSSIANHQDDPRLLQLMIEQAPRAGAVLREVAEHHRVRVREVEHWLADHPEITVEDTETAAKVIVSTVELVIHQLVASPDPVDSERLEQELVTMLTRYLTASAGEPARSDP